MFDTLAEKVRREKSQEGIFVSAEKAVTNEKKGLF